MRSIFYIIFLLLSHFVTYAQLHKAAADTEFFYCYGGTRDEEARAIKEIPGGGYIIAGTSASFGQGNTSVYLLKTDKDGKHLWSNPYGGALNDHAYSLEVTADSGYFVAGFSNSFGVQEQTGYDAYYFKTDKYGNTQWQKTIPGNDWDFLYGSAPLTDGGFILCGETYTSSNGGSDAYLVRINKAGDTLWSHHYGGLFDETFNRVCVMHNQVYAIGKNATHASDTVADAWLVKLDTNGNILKQSFISAAHHFEEVGTSLTPYNSTQFHICGSINLVDSGSIIPFLYRVDTSLAMTLIPNYFSQSPGSEVAFNQVVNTSYGDICVVGSAIGGWGGRNIFWIGYDASMQYITDYVRHSGGTADEYGFDAIRSTAGRLIAVGSEASFCSGGSDAFLVRFNTDSIANLQVQYTKTTCFKDTLFLWAAHIHEYGGDAHTRFYPNPASTQAILDIQNENESYYEARVFTIAGAEVMHLAAENKPNTVDISSLPEGSYFLQVRDNRGALISLIKFAVTR